VPASFCNAGALAEILPRRGDPVKQEVPYLTRGRLSQVGFLVPARNSDIIKTAKRSWANSGWGASK
jgi:hypothetical protein